MALSYDRSIAFIRRQNYARAVAQKSRSSAYPSVHLCVMSVALKSTATLTPV